VSKILAGQKQDKVRRKKIICCSITEGGARGTLGGEQNKSFLKKKLKNF
jgi:hypothetical protein